MKKAFAKNLDLAGMFFIKHYNADGKLIGLYRIPNGIVDVGLNHILETEFHAGGQVSTWYIGLVDNAAFSAFADTDTMAAHPGWVEEVSYSEGTRPQWTCGAAASRSITNAATVDFSINGAAALKGIFITSDNAKSGVAGTLWSTASFSSIVNVTSGDTLKITYTVSG